MTERVLTDEEIFTIICGLTRTNWDTKAIARAVEAAVLAKVPSHDAEYAMRHNAYLEAVRRERDSRVTEREARKRERAAWQKGFDRAWQDARGCVRERANYGTMLWDERRGVPVMDVPFWESELDVAYPSLLPTKRVPRTVVLSDGTKVEHANEAKFGKNYFYVHHNSGNPALDSVVNPVLSLAKTPADARLLADLVERPYDEVPDDA